MLYISSAAKFSSTSHFIMRSSLYGFPRSSWKRSFWHTGIKVIKLELTLARFPVQCYSTRRKPATGQVPKTDPKPSMEEEKNAFYVVRKGDMVGIFKNFNDCQAQVSSVADPAVSVYKGYSLPEEAEKHLISHGLKNPSYVISAAHVKEELFGTLVHCPFKQPDGSAFSMTKASTKTKRMSSELEHNLVVELAPESKDRHKKQIKVEDFSELQSSASKSVSCILEFDGASKGNPGKAGAGAILRSDDGTAVWRLAQGIGLATNNVAEYRAMILGLKYALKKGFKNIRVKGDSKLVCMQMQGLWQTKHQNMIDLCKEAKELRRKFVSFSISHVEREFNSEADAQANLGVNLGDGEVKEDYDSRS
ncbi:hypothetical protein H6P81_018944 [Aristolochia fimbriata]|uniref:RNase H type-1 domain-containing protein n=1 Tax=Aristolochia fimbriata TaxID=158543 RepID=A0AAV7E2G2_ARIFI|nr:hypothetical protein H6P81_018944 [Aristolochia fimbriata]